MEMRKIWLGCMVVIALSSCGNQGKVDDAVDDMPSDEIASDSVSSDNVVEDDSTGLGGLNAIRFNNFTDRDWYDNEYIRCLRRYLDDYNRGMIEDENLEANKDKARGSFALWSCEPSLYGGLFIRFLFIDNPNDIYSAWVYSVVDEDTETITDYEVRIIMLDDEKSGFTKDDVLKILKEHPEQKVW